MLCILFMTSCSIEGDNTVNPDIPGTYGTVTPTDEVLRSFDIKYPNAKNIEWAVKSNYYVADFTEGYSNIIAWFNQQGNWTLSKSSITSNELTADIKSAFSQSSYSGWEIKDRNILSRKDFSDMYIIEVVNGARDINIYYTKEGDLVKAVDAQTADTPLSVPAEVNNLLVNLFGNSEIIDIWSDSLGPKVGVIENNTYKVVALDSSYGWICTIWSIQEGVVPEVVMEGFKSSRYGGINVDDIKILENMEDLSYLFYFDDEGKHKIATLMESGNLKSVMSY